MVQQGGCEMGGEDGSVNQTGKQLSSKTDWTGKMLRILGPCLGRFLEHLGARTGFCKADGMGLMAGMMDDEVYMEKDLLRVFLLFHDFPALG